MAEIFDNPEQLIEKSKKQQDIQNSLITLLALVAVVGDFIGFGYQQFDFQSSQ
jgi:hypothetical protein